MVVTMASMVDAAAMAMETMDEIARCEDENGRSNLDLEGHEEGMAKSKGD